MIRTAIVEDDDLIRNGLTRAFPWARYGAAVVLSHGNGQDALKCISEGQVDLLITDVMLPGMTGIELARELRRRHWGGEIVVISAFQNAEFLQAALRMDSVDYLFKPMKISEMEAAVQRAVDRVNSKRSAEKRSIDEALEQLADAVQKPAVQDALRLIPAICDDLAGIADSTAEIDRMLKVLAEKSCLEGARKLAAGLAGRAFSTNRDKLEAIKNGFPRLIQNSRDSWVFAATITGLIRNNLKNANVDYLAGRMAVSRANFYRQYKKAFTAKPGDLILRLRMEEACLLLRRTGKSEAEIAEEVGFGDPGYFSKQFRRATGISIAEYRNGAEPAHSTLDCCSDTETD